MVILLEKAYIVPTIASRHIGWVEKSYNRLCVLPIGKEKRLHILKEALEEAKKKVTV